MSKDAEDIVYDKQKAYYKRIKSLKKRGFKVSSADADKASYKSERKE